MIKIPFYKDFIAPATPDAFVIYFPATRTLKEQVFFTEEARMILSRVAPSGTDISDSVSRCCSRWRKKLEKSFRKALSSDTPAVSAEYIEVFESYRRKYGVKGLALARTVPENIPAVRYLFILARIPFKTVNLPLISRHYKLSRREQEILKLLLAGKNNKEITTELGLSLNTVKGYLKLLFRKMGVNSRAETIAQILYTVPTE